MNNPNPFVPKGSLLEQQSRRRSHLKLGVFCVLAVGITCLAAMLIQGCKREENNPAADNNQPPVDTNAMAAVDTNAPAMETSNPPAPPAAEADQQPPPPQQTAVPPPAPAPAPVPAPAPAPTESEYVVVKGDTFSKIAKANGVSVKALEEANPNISPTRLRIGEKLVIPAGAAATGANAAAGTESGIATATGGGQVYVVKAGDNLTRIAHHFGVTIKAIEAENNLTTTRIKAGQKLTIPAKPDETPAPVNAPPAAPAAPDQNAPAAPANPPAAPSNPPGGQQ